MKSPVLSRRLAAFMVAGALIAAMILAIDYGWHKGSSLPLSIALVIGLVCVAIGEVLSWHNVAASWYERRLGALLLWGALGCMLSIGTLYTNFSTAAGNGDTKAVVHKTAFLTHDNAADRLKAAKAKRDRIGERLGWLTKISSPDAAQAKVDTLKSNKWWGTTNSCAEPKGPQTRAYCLEVKNAEAEKALALEKATLKTEGEIVEAEIRDLAPKVNTSAAVSDDAANIVALANILRVDNQTARQADSMLIAMLVQAMMLLGGILLATEHYRHIARKPWLSWNWVMSLARAWKWFTGAEAIPTKSLESQSSTTTTRDSRSTTNVTNHLHWDAFGKVFGPLVHGAKTA